MPFQAENWAGILFCRAHRSGGYQGIADIAVNLATVIGHHSRQPSKDLGEQRVESNVADTLGHGGRADQHGTADQCSRFENDR